MGIAQRYLAAHRSFVALVSALSDDEWFTPTPCTPGWTVRDVLSHVAGVTIDVSAGHVDGAATDPWTAAQVRRFREVPADELIARWEALIEPVAAVLEELDEHRPALDCHTHEHDVRHALGRPGQRESDLIDWIGECFSEVPFGRPVVAQLSGDRVYRIEGTGDALLLRGESVFDIVRARLGRRSRAQVVGWDWSEPLTDDELASWFTFGPAGLDIDE